MPNRYSQPQVVQHERVYAGMPLEEMEKANAYRQLDYNTLLENQHTTSDYLGQIQGVGNWAASQLEQRKKQDAEFVKQFDGVDLTLPQYKNALSERSRSIQNDGTLNKIQSDTKRIQEYQANKDKLISEGGFGYAPENVWAKERAIQNYSETGDLGGFDSTVEKGVDVDEEGRKLYSMIKESGGDILKAMQNDDGTGFEVGSSSKGVSLSTLNNHTNRMLGHFMNSPAGRQLQRRYLMTAEANGMEPSNKDFKEYTRMYLSDIAGGYAHGTSSTTYKQDNERNDRSAKKKEEDEAAQVTFGGAATNINYGEFVNKDDENKSLFKEDGTVNKGLFDANGNIIPANDKNPDASGGMTSKKIKQFQSVLDVINQDRDKKLTPAAYADFLAQNNKYAPQLAAGSKKAREDMEDALVTSGAFNSAPIILPSGEVMSGEDALKSLGDENGSWYGADAALADKGAITVMSSKPSPLPNPTPTAAFGIPVMIKFANGKTSQVYMPVGYKEATNEGQQRLMNTVLESQIKMNPLGNNEGYYYHNGVPHYVRGVLDVDKQIKFTKIEEPK